MTTYISGPMTGYPDLNFPAFHAAAKDLREWGFTVVNPAEFGENPGWEWSDYMRRDIKALMDCTGIYMLPGWRQSKGASLEYQTAMALGIKEVFFYDLPTVPRTIG